MTAHLHSAARTFEQILGELHPDYNWIVTVKECGCEQCAAFADREVGSDRAMKAAGEHPPGESDPS